MLPLELTLENFQGHSLSKVNFNDFSSVLIVGKSQLSDKESNGVGKSTIVKSIEYVLFNKIYADNSEKIIRDGESFCKVTFIFTEGDSNFKIERTRTKKGDTDLKLFKSSDLKDWETLTQRRVSDTEKEIKKIIKITHDSFKNSALFPQKEDSDLVSLTPEKRKALLKQTLNLAVYLKYEKLAKKKSSDLSKEIEKIKIEISTLGNQDKLLSELEINNSILNEEIISLNSYLTNLSVNFEDQQSIHLDLNSKLNLKKQLLSESLKSFEQLSLEISKLEKLKKEAESNLDRLKLEGGTIATKLQLTQDKLNKITNLLSISQPDQLKLDVESISKTIIENSSSIKSLEKELSDLLLPFPTDSYCKSCRQQMTEEHIEKCKLTIPNQIKTTKENILLIQKQNKELNISLSLKKEEISSYNNNISIKSEISLTIEYLNKEIEQKRELYKLQSARLSEIESELKFKSIELNKCDTSSIDKIKFDISSIQTNINEILKTISTISIESNKNSNIINAKKTEIAVNLSKIELAKASNVKVVTLTSKLNELTADFKIKSMVSEAFGSTGIPSLIIHNMLDDLQIETNNFLSKIKPNVQINFSVSKENKTSGEQQDTLDILFFINGKERDIQSVSGGQQLAISLSIRLALLNVLKNQYGTDIRLLMLDEVDQPLDASGLESFASIIRSLEKDYKILLITHNVSLKDHFSKAILVEQDSNMVSTLRLVDSW